jgi:Fe-Mn family superoxide dismutase
MQSDSPRHDEVHNRRTFLSQSAATLAVAGAANVLAPNRLAGQEFVLNTGKTLGWNLPELPYAYDALEPHIDAKTMEIHYTKHHQAYLDKYNAALANHQDLLSMLPTELIKKLDAVPEDIRTTVQNNGGGYVNHTFFWQIMSPDGGGEPQGALADGINQKFGSLNAFKEAFANAAGSRFGSGWAWLVKGNDGLSIISTANQDSPLTQGLTPIIGVDVWEHAYYLKYQNKRPDYVAAWWNVVNWDQAGKNYAV